MMLRHLIVAACVFAGCDKAKPKVVAEEIAAEPMPTATATEKAVQFAGRTWRYIGPAQDSGRPWMEHYEYAGDEPGVRLLEDVRDAAGKEKVYLRRLKVQRFVGGLWVDDGPNADWEIDGSRGEGNKRLGKFEGTWRGWYPNGQLHVERTYSKNESRVDGKGWYRNGQQQWESVTIDGKQVSGRSWTEDGRTFD
jgi:hypothetical protein